MLRYLGTSDDVDACDCCGRQHLKSTVGLELDDGSVVHYGVVCAARALGRSAKEVRACTRAADDERRRAERARRDAADRAEDARWQSYLDERCPEFALAGPGRTPERLRQIQALGGFTAARAAYLQLYPHN